MSKPTHTMLPTPETLTNVRIKAGLTQCQAAEMVGLAHAIRWSEIERGVRNIDPARWELFLIKVGKHQLYGPRPGVEVPTLEAMDPAIADEPAIIPPRYRRDRAKELKRRAETATK